MLRRLGIRGKILAVLAVPLLVLFTAAGIISNQARDQSTRASAIKTLLVAIGDSRDLVAALQAERDASVIAVDPNPAHSTVDLATNQVNTDTDADRVKAVKDARIPTNTVAARLRLSAQRIDYDLLDPTVRVATAEVLDAVSTKALSALRSGADNPSSTSPARVFSDFTAVIDKGIQFEQRSSTVLTNIDVAQSLAAQSAADNVAEYLERDKAIGLEMLRFGIATRGSLDEQQKTRVTRVFAGSDIIHEDATTLLAQLGDPVLALPELGASATQYVSFDSSRQLIGTGKAASLQGIREVDYRRYGEQEIAALSDVRNGLWARTNDQASNAASSALRNMLLTILATLGILAGSTIIALTTSRVITRPLRRLTVATAKVEEELPRLVEQVSVPGQGPDLELERIPVESNDEVGRLAAAFNGVNETTVRIAQEQAALRGSIAEMFVNVARRDQVLLNRQLGFLDQLERSEEDPDTLSNLFKLDHLATRMRRNAESLLVLAGIDSGRRIRGQMTLSNVIRTASSEIEHYERIQLTLPVDPSMLGHNALASAHLMAELLENATVFSEPGTPVEVETAMDEEHVTVTIADHGLGMSHDELAAANVKIASVSASDVLGTQRLGLYVVGRIAHRLGATVELSQTPLGSGTLATVVFPRTLFLAEERRELRIPSASNPSSGSIPIVPMAEAYMPSVVHDEPLAAATRTPTTSDLPVRGSGDLPVRGSGDLPVRGFDDVPVRESDDLPVFGSAPENVVDPDAPVVTAVNLAELTDGQTELGLPRRRLRSDEGPSDAGGLGTDSGRHMLPELPNLAGWSPDAPASAGPSPDVATRAGMFSGFRSRRAAAHVETETGDDVPFQPILVPSSTPLVPHAPEDPYDAPLPVPTMFVPGSADDENDEASAVGRTSSGHHVAQDASADSTLGTGLGFDTPTGELASHEEPEFQGAGFGEQEQFAIPTLVPDDDFDVTPFEEEFSSAPVIDGPEAPSVAGAAEWRAPTQGEQYPSEAAAVALEPDGFAPPRFDGSSFADAAYGAASAPEVPVRYEAYPPAEAASYPTPNAYAEYHRPAATPETERAPAFPVPSADVPRTDTGAPTYGVAPVAVPSTAPGFSQILSGAEPAARQGFFRRLFGRRKAEPIVPAAGPSPYAPPAVTPYQATPYQAQTEPVEQATPWATQPSYEATPYQAEPEPVEQATPWASQPSYEATPYQATPHQAEPEPEPVEQATPWASQPSYEATPYQATPEPVEQATPWASQPSYEATPYQAMPEPVEQATPWASQGAPWAQQAATGPTAFEPAFEPSAAPPSANPFSEVYSPEQLRNEPFRPAPLPSTGAMFTPEPDAGFAARYSQGSGDGSVAHPYTPMFVPDASAVGSIASEAARMLAERSDIAQQALSEFSQLSSYRPSTVDGVKSMLTRRVPAAVPEAPIIATRPAATPAGGAVSTAAEPREPRDAEQVRSLLASFQSGSSRGRRASHLAPDLSPVDTHARLDEEPNGDLPAGFDTSDTSSRG